MPGGGHNIGTFAQEKTGGFFYGCIWPSLASARECAWTKVFQNNNIMKNFEKVHWEGACKE